MRYIDVTGKTEEEAVRKALEQLHLERDDVSLEILERSKSGFLGIGSSPAKVRVRYELDVVEEPEVKTPAPQAKPAEKKAAAEGTLTSPDDVNRLSREVGWRLHALRILKGESNAEE